MTMTRAEIIAAINANHTCYMATVEGNKPRVRGINMHKADERGLIFQTWVKKDLHGQLAKSPQVELCFPIKDGSQIRITGKMELVDDLALKKEIEAQRTFMTPIIKQFGGYDAVAIWVLKKGQAQIWSMKENFTPKTYIEI
jgi:pyridoxamine 5'-phosphate oxidase